MVSVTALGKAQKNPGTSHDISSQGQLPSEGQRAYYIQRYRPAMSRALFLQIFTAIVDQAAAL